MRCFTRYVIGQVLAKFTVTAVALSVLLLLLGVAKEALSEGLGMGHVLRLFPYLLPNALLFAVPGATLFAVCLVYGRMSSENEVVALKSLGIHPLAPIWPSLAVAALLSLLTVWLNDVAVSWGYRGAQKLILEAVEDIAYRTLAVRHSFSSRSFSVYAARVEGKKLIDATFSFQAGEDTPAGTITAQEAELRTDAEAGVLDLIFTNGDATAGQSKMRFPGTIEYQLSLDRVARKGSSSASPAHLSLSEIPLRIVEQERQIARVKDQMAADSGFSILTGDFALSSAPNWSSRLNGLAEEQLLLGRLRLEPPRRWANGFSCFCFALVGIPMSIRLRNTDFLMSFFLCFLPILVVYYPLMMFAVDRAKAGGIPAYSIWLPNVALSLWSYWLFRRVIQH